MGVDLHEGTCPEHRGKRLYRSKSLARAFLRLMGGYGRGMRPYRCEHRDGYWHVGHLQVEVRRGEMTHAEYMKMKGGQGGQG